MKRVWVDRSAVQGRKDDVLLVADDNANVVRGNEVIISGPCRVVYDKTVTFGVRVWIETDAEVETKK